MKTEIKNQKMSRISLLVCFFLLALTTPSIAQNTDSNTLFESIDSGLLFCVLSVIVLATFMFVAMYKSKTKESREYKNRHRLHMHRKQAHINHFKY